jgi:hypothetical protein
MIVSALVLLAASQSAYYKLDSEWTPYGNAAFGLIAETPTDGIFTGSTQVPWKYGKISYTCSYENALDMTPYLDHPYIRDNLCVVKCAADPSASGCFNFIHPNDRKNLFPDYKNQQTGAWFDGVSQADQHPVSDRSCLMRLDADGNWYQDNTEPVGQISWSNDYFCGRTEYTGNSETDWPQYRGFTLSGSYDTAAASEGLKRINDMLCAEPEEIAAMCHYVEECTMMSMLGEDLLDDPFKKAGRAQGDLYPQNSMSVGVAARLYGGKCDNTNGYGSAGSLAECAVGDNYGELCMQPQIDIAVVSYWAQKVTEHTPDDACPLGRGVEVMYGEADGAAVRGLYQKLDNGNYLHIDGLGHKIEREPQSSGDECGWRITELVYNPAATTPTTTTCVDDDLALNYLLGQCDDPLTCATRPDPDYEANLCSTLMTVWSSANKGYCSDPLYAGVCRATCATEIGAASCGADIDGIAHLHSDYVCTACATPADLALCPVACAGVTLSRRLTSEVRRPIPVADFAGRLSALYTTSRTSSEQFGANRRLQTLFGEEIAYKSCGACGSDCAPALPSGGWRNWRTLHSCVAGNVELSCPAVTQFVVYEMMYCSLTNIGTALHPNKKIQDNACALKCGDRTEDGLLADGTSDYCSGNRGIVGKNDDALCVPQEMCEELCEAEAECTSFDKHRRYPRCYLNRGCPSTAGHSPADPALKTARRPSPNDVAVKLTGYVHDPMWYGADLDGDGSCVCNDASGNRVFGKCACAYNLMINDDAHQFDLWFKLETDRRPSIQNVKVGPFLPQADNDGPDDGVNQGHVTSLDKANVIYNAVMPGPSYHSYDWPELNYLGTAPIARAAYTHNIAAPPLDNLRNKFVTHTGWDCQSASERLPRVDIDSWNAMEDAGTGIAFEDLAYTVFGTLDTYFRTQIKGYRRACELYCRESETCAGFQYTPLVVTTAHNAARFEADDAATRRRRSAANAPDFDGEDSEVNELDDMIFLPDGICFFYEWSDMKVVDGELNGCLEPVNNTYVTDGTTAGTSPAFIDIADDSNFTYVRPTMFVQKVPFEMCTAKVTGLPVEEAQFEGEYVKRPQRRRYHDPYVWQHVENKAALVWSSEDSTSECDSWALYENLEKTSTTLEVCADFPEALAAYFASGPITASTDPPNLAMAFTGYEFPCQTGVEKGYCDNYVFAGLCPHSCQPMVDFTGDFGARVAYKRAHGYQSFTEPSAQQWQQQTKVMYEHTERFQALFGDDSCSGAADDGGYCNSNCTTGPYGKLTDCTDCLGAGSAFCNKAVASNSECGGDNNVAMFFFAYESSWIGEVDAVLTSHTPFDGPSGAAGGSLPWSQFREEMSQACTNVIRTVFFDAANFPCKPNPRMNHLIVKALCPATCAQGDPPAPSPASPLDEADPAGASRQLSTVSWSGKMSGLGELTSQFKYEYSTSPLDVEDASKVRIIYRSHSYTSARDASAALPLVGGAIPSSHSPFFTGCANDNSMGKNPGLDQHLLTNTMADVLDGPTAAGWGILGGIGKSTCFYQPEFKRVEPSNLVVQPVCRAYGVCPALATCALAPSRFTDEIQVWRYSIGLTRTTHLMEVDSATKDQIFSTSHYVPKVITSVDRAEAIMTSSTLPYFKSIYRTAPGAMRVNIVDDPAVTVTGEYLVVVLYKAEEGVQTALSAGSALPSDEGGLLYVLPSSIASDYMATPVTDVIRIERFTSDTTPLYSGKFTVDLTLPTFDLADLEELDLFEFPVIPGAPPKKITDLAGVSMALSPDGTKLRLTVPAIEGDLLIFQDADECASNPCDAVGICTNTKPGHTCSCPETHVCDGTGCGSCKLKTQSLPDYYLLLKHTSRLDYGWRVDEVKFYTNEDCTGPITAGIQAGSPVSLADHGLGTATSYPGGHGPASVSATAGSWWSSCITCNPDEMFDSTHGGPATLEWKVDGDTAIGCIEVVQGSVLEQYGGHASRGLKVERGPVSRASPACGGAAGPRCQPTMTVTADCGDTAADSTDTCASTKISLGCGMPETLLWGEILEPAGTENYGFYGSYGVRGGVAGTLLVPSSCHCHELCISHTSNMCRSYKFFHDGATKHCMLQTSEFFTYTAGVVGAPEGSVVTNIASYTSGTPMDRFASIGTPRVLGAAKPWVESFSFVDGVISVHGYGFPTKNSVTKADRGRYQRVKVVAKGTPCSSAVPSAVTGIGCVNTLLKSYAEPDQKSTLPPAKTSGVNEMSVYTVCSTRPSSWTSETVMWDGISISAGSMDTSYDVCYCDGKECSRPESWVKVPPLTSSDGVIGAGEYVYVASATSIERGSSVDIGVTGPAFGTANSSYWEIKAVPSHFACSVSSTFTDATSTPVTLSEADFTLTISAVGDYTICLALGSGEDFTALAGTITVVALGTDRTHAPNGAVYREQRWSALTGGPSKTLSLKGTNLPAVSDSKVVLSMGDTCEWPEYSFGGAVKRQPTADKTAPQVIWSSTVPANAEVVSKMTTLKVVFNELLSEPENCLGGYTLKKVTGGPTYTAEQSAKSYFIACDSANKTIIDNFVLLEFEEPVDGTYALFFDSYTIADLDGNNMFLSGSLDESTGAAAWVFEIGTDATVPTLLTSEPKFGLVTGTGVLSLTFSEPVVPMTTGYADLIDCGDDFVCDPATDNMIAKYEFSDPLVDLTNVSVSKVFTIDLTSIVDVYNYKRYYIYFAAGSFRDEPTENLAPEIVLEFMKGPEFDLANALPPSSSSVDALTYDLELTAAPGTYSLCYCDAQYDTTLFDAADGKTTAKPTFGQKATASTSFTDIPVGSRALSEHVCSTKCAAGCVGDDCFCSGFDSAGGDMSTVYCLSPALCRSTCDELGAACAGFGTKGEDSCVLYQSGFSLSPAGAWTSYTKEMGTACTDPSDFSTLVGKATVTSRADVYAEYVVEPNVETVLEIAGTKLLSMKGGIARSDDRIMVVDCDGMCGYSAASTSVELTGAEKVWNDLGPLQWSVDKPHEDTQNTLSTSEKWSPASWEAHSCATGEYTTIPSAFCPKNLKIASLDDIPMEGHERYPTIHLCYNKCIEQDCVGDDCFCEGAYTGYDTDTSNALCADEALCQHLCDSYEECKSIDMAKDKPRCFLNTKTCDASDTTAPTPDNNYDILVKVNDQTGCRKLESSEPVASAEERSLLPAIPSGYSHSKLLIFPNIKFTSGGKFKVCFCDSTLLGDDGCTKPEHYGVEVGEVQASGISCLLTNPLYNRKTCVSMGSAGALRCYSGAPPDTEPPMYPDVAPEQPLPTASGPGEPVTSTYCRLHPELCR